MSTDTSEKEHCVDLVQLRGFLLASQPELVETFALHTDGPTRRKLLARLQGQISARGVIDVLRHGVKHGPQDLTLFFGSPTPVKGIATERCAKRSSRSEPSSPAVPRDLS
jgi:type I restriction enzyme, R subunit